MAETVISAFGLELKWLSAAVMVWFGPRRGDVVLMEQEECSYWTLSEQESDSAGSHWWTGTEEAGSSGMVEEGAVEEEEVGEKGLRQAVWVLDWTTGSAVDLWRSGS